MATVAEVVERAANELGILAVGQTLPAHHNTRITAAYNEIYGVLKSEGLAVWDSNGTIPNEVVPMLSMLMADACSNTYGVSNDRYTRIKNAVGGEDGDKAKRAIRKIIATEYVSMADPVGY